ncbi:prolyl oligopeptidase family serine peptidase [Geotoga petraea]|uniref:prolyl oligopeptidase family serine peptidase n=1 Tax=Geotoga petraea TaxID=28234 RepID=UPI00197ABEA2|nr:prolyl oligopeptidase family serine peptidase [Geotoga petraea]
MKYPKAKKVDQVDDYFGYKVEDPYRWMENEDSEDLKKWIEEENKLTFDYLKKIPFRNKIKKRLKELNSATTYGDSFLAGDYLFFYKNEAGENQPKIYFQKGLEGNEELFFDPNELSDDGTVSVTISSFSKDNKYITFNISESGSDWQKIKVMDIENKKMLDDELKKIKMTNVSWFKNGFFYSGFDHSAEALSEKNKNLKVYYHILGTKQEEDMMIYEDEINPERFVFGNVTHNEKYMFVETTEGTSGKEVFIKDLKENSEVKLLFKGFDFEYDYIGDIGDRVLFMTNEEAPMNKIIQVDPKTMKKSDLIQETIKFDEARVIKNHIVVKYIEDVKSKVVIFDYNGEKVEEVILPDKGLAYHFQGNEKSEEFTFHFTSFTYPVSIFSFDTKNKKLKKLKQSESKINPEDFTTEQIFYKSKDGTDIPMFIIKKKGLKLDGKNPTLLYAYGGFNISIPPFFDPNKIWLLENNGIFAMANIRGGGEYGEKWHKSGMMQNKQNVFDDFISAAEYLIDNGYTSKDKLAVEGRSNGGLLIGAVMNQRPDLFKVAFPSVGVMDMLRFQHFTIGWAWKVEYGSSDNSKEEFENLYKYSPLHNISEEKNYPSTMVITADHDDRVVPAHSFKYTATLQEKYKGSNPILIRINTKSGHGAGRSLEKTIEEKTDLYSFMFFEMGEEI